MKGPELYGVGAPFKGDLQCSPGTNEAFIGECRAQLFKKH